MSDNDIVKLPILEPLASYFGTLYKFKTSPNYPDDVKINLEEPEKNDIFWKMYANTLCYPPDSNKNSENGDIAHQFTQAVVVLAKNLKEIDPSTSTGTIQEYLVNKIKTSIQKVLPNIIDQNLVNTYFEKIMGGIRNQLILKKDYYDNIIQYILHDFDEIININEENKKSCDTFKKLLINSKIVAFDTRSDYITLNGEEDADKYQLEQCYNYINKWLPIELTKLIKDAGNKCYRRDYKFISDLTLENKKKVSDTITMIKNSNDALLLFNKYFELIDKNNNKKIDLDNLNDLNDLNDLRINLIKYGNGYVELFEYLPFIKYKEGTVEGIFISPEEKKNKINLIDIANDYYRNKNKLNIIPNYKSLDYTEAVCKKNKSQNNTAFDIPAIKNLLQNWLRTELSSSSMYSTPSSYRVLTTKKERDAFVEGLVDEEKEMEKIIKDLPMNEWVKRGSVYYKRETDGKETRYNLGNEKEFNDTCLSIGATANNCVKVLTKAVSGNLEELKELLLNDNFVDALINPDLVKQLPPQIALKLLKTFGFKKTVIPSAKGPIFIIEPIEGWLSRLSKTTNGFELVKTINSNPNFMTLIRFLVGIVHQNPTIIGNNPSVVIPEQPIPTPLIKREPVPWPTWPKMSINKKNTSSTNEEKVHSIEDIKKNLKASNRFYNGLDLSNTPFGLSNFNPALERLLSFLPYYASNGLVLNGGGNSRVVAKVQVGLGFNYADEFIRVYNIIKKKLGTDLPDGLDKVISPKLRAFKSQEEHLLEELSKLQKLSTLKELGLLEGVTNDENYIDNNLENYQNKIDNYMKNRKKTDNTLKTLMKMYQHLLPANLYDIRI